MPPQVVPAARRAARRARDFAIDAAGGRARMRVVLTLAAVLGLSGADTGTVSATAGNLERAFGIGNTQIGVLLSVVGLVGALFTIPAGILADRTRRTRLLGGSIVVWAAAVVVSGAATSYLWLLLARVGLGAATAVAGPTLASLTGDYFPAADRGRMYGLILGGDLVGSGFGYLVSGDLSSLTTWRVAFWWLAIPSLALAWVVWRLPEPARGGFSRIAVGQEEIRDERDVEPGQRVGAAGGAGEQAGAGKPELAERAVRQAEVEPRHELVLSEDPTNRPWWWAVRYVLRVRTNVVIIVASALGYFFFAGLRSFAVIFATGHYGISKPMATSLILVIGGGALAGVFTGGRVADRLLRRGNLRRGVPVVPDLLHGEPQVVAGVVSRYHQPEFAVVVPVAAAGLRPGHQPAQQVMHLIDDLRRGGGRVHRGATAPAARCRRAGGNRRRHLAPSSARSRRRRAGTARHATWTPGPPDPARTSARHRGPRTGRPLRAGSRRSARPAAVRSRARRRGRSAAGC
jgi:predicted MFS family arabinose efflux permease